MTSQSVEKISNREIAERVSRCVATMVYYQVDKRSQASERLLNEEVQSLLEWSSRPGLFEGLEETILAPLQVELLNRYGSEVAPNLYREFLHALQAVPKRKRDSSQAQVIATG